MINFILKCRHGIALLVRNLHDHNLPEYICARTQLHTCPPHLGAVLQIIDFRVKTSWGVGQLPQLLGASFERVLRQIFVFFFVGFKFQLQSSGASSTHRVSVDGMDFKFASKQLTLYYAKPTLSRIPTVIQEADFVQDNKA